MKQQRRTGSAATFECYHGGKFTLNQVPCWANSGQFGPRPPIEGQFRAADFLRRPRED